MLDGNAVVGTGVRPFKQSLEGDGTDLRSARLPPTCRAWWGIIALTPHNSPLLSPLWVRTVSVNDLPQSPVANKNPRSVCPASAGLAGGEGAKTRGSGEPGPESQENHTGRSWGQRLLCGASRREIDTGSPLCCRQWRCQFIQVPVPLRTGVETHLAGGMLEVSVEAARQPELPWKSLGHPSLVYS